MPTGIVLFTRSDATNAVDDLIDQARQAYDAGVRQVWIAQQLDIDAIATSALIGAAVPGLGVGTSVVPINPRHPLVVASLAQTAQAATHGSFTLGVGLGGHEIERQTFGIPSAGTVERLREHLTVLRSVFDTGTADFEGEHITARPSWPTRVAGGTPVPLYVAAMGPRALQLTGELADGTLPYLAGPRTIGEFIRPTIDKAAADAGRPRPRIVAAMPVAVTDDVDAARALAREALALYTTIPSYQRVLEREGADHPADLAAIGSADQVTEVLQSYRDAGADDVVLAGLDRGNTAAAQRVWEVAAAFD